MNITIKTVISPFSFFCVAEDEKNNNPKKVTLVEHTSDQIDFLDINHGQYVAVLWNAKWVRGITSMESNFLIWLVDEGIYIRPTDKTVYVNLAAEYKKLPSKVFEASIHGVTPVGLELNEFYDFKKETTLMWSIGAVEKAQQLIFTASSVYFVPVAMLSTKTNDIVIGDLYLQFQGKGLVNFIDEMSSKSEPLMHTFMERNTEVYVQNLRTFYSSRRVHRACLLKPDLPTKDLPTISTETTLSEYSDICDKVEPLYTQQDSDTDSVGGSSVTYIENTNDVPNQKLKLTYSEIEKYSNEYIIVGGREYNVLTVLMNKARDLYMCEKYKDAKSVGRATTRLRV